MLALVLAGVAAIILFVIVIALVSRRRPKVPPVAVLESGRSHLREGR